MLQMATVERDRRQHPRRSARTESGPALDPGDAHAGPGAEFADFLGLSANGYPHDETIHLVMDNLNTNCRKALVDRFGETEGDALWSRFAIHYTPKHGSWLNQAEVEISLFSRQCLGKRRIADLISLRRQACAWNRHINRQRVRINWRFDRKQARRTFRYTHKIKRAQT